MSRRIFHHSEKAPKERLDATSSTATFFPGEVARLLGLRGVDYDQLRRIFVLARVLRGEPRPGRGWSKFSIADLAAAEVLVRLGGGRTRLFAGRRLVLGDVERACHALRRLGIANPLIEVPLARAGRRVFAKVGEYVFEPTTGQLVLETVDLHLDEFFRTRPVTDRKVARAIDRERATIRPIDTRRFAVSQRSGQVILVVA